MKINVIIEVDWILNSTRLRPLALSYPKPLMPVGGYPIIFHHLKALQVLNDQDNNTQINRVFLHGQDNPEDYLPFIEQVEHLFDFVIEFMQVDTQVCNISQQEKQDSPAVGSIFSQTSKVLQGDPELFFLMHCDIISSFPLAEMIEFHQNQTEAMCTVMTSPLSSDWKPSKDNMYPGFGFCKKDAETDEMIHFTQQISNASIRKNMSTNCGLYLFDSKVLRSGGESTTLKAQFQEILKFKQKKHEDVGKIQQLAKFFHEFTEEVIHEVGCKTIGIKDVLSGLSKNKQVVLFTLDTQKHFWMRVQHSFQLFNAQEIMFKHYSKEEPQLLLKSADEEYETVGLNFIHHSAEIHSTAKIGPNVMIGAQVKVGEGVRVVNSILLADAVIQPHACVINTIIGWTSLVGPWARIEGVYDANSQKATTTSIGKQAVKKSEQDENVMLGIQGSTNQYQIEESFNQDGGEGIYHRQSEAVSCHEKMRVLSNGITVIGAGVVIEPEIHIRNCVVLPNINVHESAFHQIII